MRLMTGLLAGQAFASELIGDASLMQRPMERVAAPLRLMGAQIETRAGKPPVRISGGQRLQGIRYDMPVASAQVKSAVLLAGLYADGVTTVIEPGGYARPYRADAAELRRQGRSRARSDFRHATNRAQGDCRGSARLISPLPPSSSSPACSGPAIG